MSTPFSRSGSAGKATRTFGPPLKRDRFLATHDLNFSDVRKFRPGSHAGVLIVRLPDSEQWRVGDHLVAWYSDPDARSWERCLVVATLRKVRVVRGGP